VLDVYLTKFALKRGSRRTAYDDVVSWAGEELGLDPDDFQVDGEAERDSLRGRWFVDRVEGRPAIDVSVSRFRDDGFVVVHRVEVVALDRPHVRAAVSVRKEGGSRQIAMPEALNPPRLVQEWVATGDAIDRSYPLGPEPIDVPVTDLDKFLEKLRGDRALPVVCFSVDRHGQDTEVARTSRLVAGAAHLVRLSDDASWRFSHEHGKWWSTYNSAVRVYRPGLDWRQKPQTHPLFIPQMNVPVVDAIPEMVRNAVVRDAHLHGFTNWAIPWERLRRIREQMEEVDGAADEYAWVELLEEVEQERDELRREVEALQAALELASAETSGPGSVYEALVAFAERDPGGIVLLPAAFESAQRASFRRPHRAQEVLEAIGELGEAYHSGTLDTDFESFLRFRGVKLGYVSSGVRKMHPDEYTRIHGGRTIELSDHAKVGTGPPTNHFRVYWYRDEETRTLVIGHVGNHLPNKMT
jgi:hypothetical protein